MRFHFISLMAVMFSLAVLTGCPGTSNTPHSGTVTVGISGVAAGEHITQPRVVTVTTSSTGGHITNLTCTIDGTEVFNQNFDNSSVSQTVTLPAGVLDMGNHTFTATATDANSNHNSSSVTYSVNP